MPSAAERYLTVDETAARISMSRATVYRLLASGELRHVRIAGRIRVPERAITEMAEGGEA